MLRLEILMLSRCELPRSIQAELYIRFEISSRVVGRASLFRMERSGRMLAFLRLRPGLWPGLLALALALALELPELALALGWAI